LFSAGFRRHCVSHGTLDYLAGFPLFSAGFRRHCVFHAASHYFDHLLDDHAGFEPNRVPDRLPVDLPQEGGRTLPREALG